MSNSFNKYDSKNRLHMNISEGKPISNKMHAQFLCIVNAVRNVKYQTCFTDKLFKLMAKDVNYTLLLTY